MDGKDLENQIEGLFSGIVPEPEAEEEESLAEESLLEEVVADLLEETVTAEPVAVEPIAVEPAPAELEAEEKPEIMAAALPEGEAATAPVEVEPAVTVPEAAKAEVAEPVAEEAIAAVPTAVDALLRERRTRILNTLLGILTGISTLVVVTLVVDLVQQPSLLRAYIPYFVAYVLLLLVTLVRRLNWALRATTPIVLFYAVGIISTLNRGSLGPGDLYLLVAPLVVFVLFDHRVGAITAAVSATIYAGLVIAQRQGWFEPSAAYHFTEWSTVLNLGGTFAMLAAAAAFVQWMSHAGLISALRQAEERRAETARSQALLAERADELATTNILLQKRTLQLQTAAQVSQAAASVLDLDELAERAVNLIREQFGLHYVGLYLTDASSQWAVLRAGTGEIDHPVLVPGYSLQVDGVSAVGQCIANAQAHSVSDVEGETVPPDNTLLPGTRSEVALPLRSRGRVIGALDVQSTKREAFSHEDVTVMQTVADQMAVGIDNARLLAETQKRLAEIEADQRRYLREQWADIAARRAAPFYERARPDVPPLGRTTLVEDFGELSRAVEQAMAQQDVIVRSDTDGDGEQAVLVAPIRLRGEVIGTLGLYEEEGRRQWMADEIALIEAVADQMALAIENARLIAETQQHAERDRLIADATTRVRASMDLESILQTAVRELGAALGADRAFIRLGGGTQKSEPFDSEVSERLGGTGTAQAAYGSTDDGQDE